MIMFHIVLTKVPNKLQTFFSFFCCMFSVRIQKQLWDDNAIAVVNTFLFYFFFFLAFHSIQLCTIAMLFIQSEALLVYFISWSCFFSANQHASNLPSITTLCIVCVCMLARKQIWSKCDTTFFPEKFSNWFACVCIELWWIIYINTMADSGFDLIWYDVISDLNYKHLHANFFGWIRSTDDLLVDLISSITQTIFMCLNRLRYRLWLLR